MIIKILIHAQTSDLQITRIGSKMIIQLHIIIIYTIIYNNVEANSIQFFLASNANDQTQTLAHNFKCLQT